MPITNRGASAQEVQMMTLLASPFKWALAFSMVVRTLVDSTASIAFFDVDRLLVLEEGD